MRTALEFWGKARPRTDAGPRWHPLVWHSIDVAAVLERLLASPAFAGAVPVALHRPLVALAALHDIGKFTRGFQALVPEHWPTALGPFAGRVASVRHDTLGWQILTDERLEADVAWLLPGWDCTVLDPLLRAVTGHHGRPPEEPDALRREVFCPACCAAAREWMRAVGTLLGPADDPRLSEPEAARLSWMRSPRARG